MKDSPREITEEEIKYLVQIVAAPTFKYMMKRINNNILLNSDYADMSLNSFISVLIISIASMDANLLKWIDKFYSVKTGKKIDFEKLKFSLTKNLHEQLGIELH